MPKEYIERKDAAVLLECFDQKDPLGHTPSQIVAALPAADVVAVVRCGECIRKNICWVVSGDDNWYCADGEREDGGTDYGKTS